MTDKMTAEQALEMLADMAHMEAEEYAAAGGGSRVSELENVIRAALSQRVPEGRKLVPVEPTKDMINAACDAESLPLPMWNRMENCYRAMLAASPAQSADSDEIARLMARVKGLEKQWSVVFDGHAVMKEMESRNQYAYPPLICATLDAVAKIGKERAGRLSGGGDV